MESRQEAVSMVTTANREQLLQRQGGEPRRQLYVPHAREHLKSRCLHDKRNALSESGRSVTVNHQMLIPLRSETEQGQTGEADPSKIKLLPSGPTWIRT